jgi:hypothetical protein
MARFDRIRLVAVNGLIAALFALILIDALPLSPLALHHAIQPIVQRLGIQQGKWNMFTPEPDSINHRLRAEITYRDGQKAVWQTPEWRSQRPWQRWIGNRHQEWHDRMLTQEAAPAWEAWARSLARSLRPDLTDADRGAEVRITYQEAPIPPAEERPWTTWREPPPFGEAWTLTIEKFP